MNQLSGREHFFNGILNVLEGINSVLNPIRDGFGDVFMTDGSPLYNFLKGFDELTGKMALSEETAEKVQNVFTGVFRVLSIGLKGVKTVGKTVFMILGKLLDLLSPMGDLLLNIGSCIGNLLTWVDESLGQAESLSDVLGILVGAVAALVSPIADVVKGVKTLVRGGNMEEAKKQFGAFGTVVDAVGSVLDKFKIGSVSAGNVIGTAFQLLGGILLGAFEGIGALIGRAFNGFKGAGDTAGEYPGRGTEPAGEGRKGACGLWRNTDRHYEKHQRCVQECAQRGEGFLQPAGWSGSLPAAGADRRGRTGGSNLRCNGAAEEGKRQLQENAGKSDRRFL